MSKFLVAASPIKCLESLPYDSAGFKGSQYYLACWQAPLQLIKFESSKTEDLHIILQLKLVLCFESYLLFVYSDSALYREHHLGGRAGDRGSFSGPLLPTGERPGVDHRPANGVHGISRPSNGM
jgi:hypothetical protein